MWRIRRTLPVAVPVVLAVLAGLVVVLAETSRQKTTSGTAVAVQQCRQTAPRNARLGAPIIYTRGSFTAVLFVDHGNNRTYFCYHVPGESSNQQEPAAPARHGVWAAPPPTGIQDGQGGEQLCDTAGLPNMGEMYGYAGTEVTDATFEFTDDPSVRALVKRGFYIASWPYTTWPDKVALKTKSGASVSRDVPNTGIC